jgi:hypothetical protein
MRSRRAAGVGYGKKYDFSKVVASNPGPSQYKNPSVFDRNKRKNIGKTFGVSRERMAATGAMVINMNQPGPGQYKLKKRFKNLRYSMRAKTLNPCKAPLFSLISRLLHHRERGPRPRPVQDDLRRQLRWKTILV